jgi:hypothetical protein
MNKGIIRAFALGMLLATSVLGTAYYNASPHLTKKELEAHAQKQQLVLLSKTEYESLRAAATRKAQPSAPKAPKTEPPKTVHVYRLVIRQGDVPAKFAKELEQANIIADAKKLTGYLEARGLTRSIRPGAYDVRSDMSYEEIARILTSAQK